MTFMIEMTVTRVEQRRGIEMQSLGWFVSFDQKITIGGWRDKPAFELGDRVRMILEKIDAVQDRVD